MRTLVCIAVVLLTWAVSSAGEYTMSEQEAQRIVTSTPQPDYPYEARRHWIEGHGLFVLRVQIRTGLVKTVMVERSTGSPLLDNAAVAALKRWRFKAGALRPISVQDPSRKDPFAKQDSFVGIPVNFSMKHGVRSRMAGAALDRPY